MTEQSEHLSSAQIENYGNRTSGAGPEAAQRDEHQRADHQSSDDQRVNDQAINDRQIDDRQINDQRIHDRQIDDLKISDLKIADPKMNDQRVEAHLADCASCRARLLDFHRNLFASPADPPEPDRLKADKPKNDEPTTDPPEHDTSLPGHSLAGHSPSGQRPADSKLEGARPTNSALADSKFANPKYPVQAQVRTAPTPECPSDDTLRQLAAGLTPDDVAAKLTQHAATCNHCGPLLRTYTEIFSDDFTPEEQAALANLQSSSAAWQKNTARKMLRVGATLAPRDGRLQFLKQSTLKWALASAFLLVLVAGVRWVYPLLILHKASLAVEAEYRKGRPMEYRVAGVPYGPYQGELGGRGIAPIIEIPNPERAPLLAANAALLQDDYTAAESILKNALKSGGTLALRNNLAVAYALEADHIQPTNEEDKKRQQEIYLVGLAITEEILHQNSSDAAALFNRALILDRVGRGSEAPALLKQIKEVEQDTGWRQEAEEKLQLMR